MRRPRPPGPRPRQRSLLTAAERHLFESIRARRATRPASQGNFDTLDEAESLVFFRALARKGATFTAVGAGDSPPTSWGEVIGLATAGRRPKRITFEGERFAGHLLLIYGES